MATGTRLTPRRRRWPFVVGGLVALLAAGALIGLFVVYPRVGASRVRAKLVTKAAELGRTATIGSVTVELGHASITGIAIAGPLDGGKPLVTIDRVEVEFDTKASLFGSIKLGAATVDGVTITMHRDAQGRDNVRDLLDKLRATKPATGDERAESKLPTSIEVTKLHIVADDAVTGAQAAVGNGEIHWKPGDLVAEVRAATATSTGAPKAGATKLVMHKQTGKPPQITVEGGSVTLLQQFELSGIGGTIIPADDGTYVATLAGGYGGVAGQLWTAKGTIDPAAVSAHLDLEAEKFQLERLAPILAKSAVVDYGQTSIDSKIHLDVGRAGAKFSGELHVRGLNVGHPMIADREVHDLDLTANVAGSFDRKARKVELTRGDFVTRDVPFSLVGSIAAPKDAVEEVAQTTVVDDPKHGPSTTTVPTHGPHGIKQVHLHFVVPPIDCQRMLLAFPTEMAPYLAGYKLKGVFDTDVQLDIDWADLDKTALDGHVGIKHCTVKSEPSDSPRRLKEEFEHYVEVDKGQWLSFVVGPSNEDFVPIEDISPYLVKSIMSTEDSAFYQHRGFIPSEFRTALVSDLKAGAFRYGASSITMQMVKNVLLYREKTLARKLQELFLTWHVENTLTKDRIMEIYLNVIEYGPGLYGIGPAAKHYFGKPAKDLTPTEAAFFSTILPNPKDRYRQYCSGELTKWTTDKIDRILAIMLKRDRLTQEEYDKAKATPLLFTKDGSETEEECLKRVKKAIKNGRPTNPRAK